MPDKKLKAYATGASPGEMPKHGQSSATGAGEHKEQRKAHRFRVGWHTDIILGDQSTHQGFINDISTMGASIFLSDGLTSEKATLHIHVPPLSRTSAPHVIVVTGKSVYVVFDGDKQMFRTAFVFLKFQQESDQAYLEERLSKYQMEIHESISPHKIVEL